MAHECQPDVLVIDLSMPDMGGAETTAQVTLEYPQIRVLALTRHDDPTYLRRLLHAGAAGYVLKKTAADELINAIRIVAQGGVYIDPRLAGYLLESVDGRSTSAEAERPRGELTAREEEVLRLIAWGRSNKEIATELSISVKTVEYHKANAADKLRLHTRTDILRYALAQRWLEEDKDPE
jgi:DNA-binding NarL/FixJ family response regulator